MVLSQHWDRTGLCSRVQYTVLEHTTMFSGSRGMENEHQADRTTILARSDLLEISDNLRSALLPISNRNDRIPEKFMIPGDLI